MNIIILANSDLASNYTLNLLLPKLKQHQIRLYLSAKVGGKSKPDKLIPQELQQLKFFEQALFNKILFPLLENSLASESTAFKSFNQLESFLQKPLQLISDINNEKIISEFKQFNTDLIISIRFGLILKEPVISTSRYGVINLHSGALPQLQGVMPTFRAMLMDHSQITANLHYISNSKIDQGEIISTYSVAIDTEHSYLWNLLKLYKAGYNIIVDAVTTLETGGKLNSSPQQGESCYFSFPNTKEFHDFSEKGYKLFDYHEILEIVALYTQNIH